MTVRTEGERGASAGTSERSEFHRYGAFASSPRAIDHAAMVQQ
jgi:hypothetical protein